VDQTQAAELLTDRKDKQQRHRDLMRDINATQQDLFGKLLGYSEIYYGYVEEWDHLSLLRDRAYLAAHNQDWDAVIASSELAMEKAPNEREAHLLAAMAMIERGDDEVDRDVTELLSDYIQNHPDHSAPAFLLMGVHHANMGRDAEALLALQQSAAYYPRQAEHLTDMLDPYKMRGFLRQSREGNFIVAQYKATMLGAGYYSPDLQMARLHFEQGDFEGGQKKVADHFARRRAQQQWDFIINDIQFCEALMGPYYREIFPADSYLDLEVSPAMWGDALNLGIKNRSDRTLHNATLVLTLHMTDMHPDDYEPLIAGDTQPAVLAGESTSFGQVPVALDIGGQIKGVEDIVHHRAILISNEAVVWVDTDEFKIAEAKEFRELRGKKEAAAAEVGRTSERTAPGFRTSIDELVDEVSGAATLSVESSYGQDDVLVQLPKELTILRPLFRLKYGDTIYNASDNVVDGDHIALRFPNVDNFDAAEGGHSDDLELLLASPFGDIALTWVSDGGVLYRFAGLERE
jgi:hypothetical protein